jgi:hypothetical protein
LAKVKKKSLTIKETAYKPKYEHILNKRWTESEIECLADEMFDWFMEKEEEENGKEVYKNIWLRDFAISKMISQTRIGEFAKKNEYFANILDICKSKQESILFTLGLTSKGAMPIFALKNISKWTDGNTESNNNISETELESLKAVAKREMENNL